MATVDRMTVNGQDYRIADSQARYNVDELKKSVSYIKQWSAFNLENCKLNAFIDVDGQEKAQNNWIVTDYIPVPAYANGVTALNYVIFNGTQPYRMENQWIATYDANKNFIAMVTSDPDVPIGLEHVALGDNVKYIRLDSYIGTDLENVVIVFDYEKITNAMSDKFAFVGRNDGAGVIGDDGAIIAHSWFGYTDFIPVPGWANRLITYNIVSLAGGDYALKDYQFATYDANKNFIANVKGNTFLGYVSTDIDPTVARFVRVDYGVQNISDCVAIFDRVEISGDKKWNGKTGDFLGDSITAQNQYTAKMTSLFGITVNNYGVSGTTISNVGGNNYFATRIQNMSGNCDFVFVLGGTNDWGLNAPLGTPQDTTVSTFYGGLHVTFSALRAKFPTKNIFVSTILQRDWQQDTQQASGIDSNGNGNSIMEFNDAIATIAHRFGFVIIDGFGESGICVPNITTYCSDRLHLNATGGTRYATFVKDCMERYSPQ